MSKSTPTPGPWTAEPKGRRGAWIKDSTGEWAALSCSGTDETAEANARQIITAVNAFEPMLDALKRARQFIVNGVELGFIRMPDASTPDPAHQTLPAIEEAIRLAAPEPRGRQSGAGDV